MDRNPYLHPHQDSTDAPRSRRHLSDADIDNIIDRLLNAGSTSTRRADLPEHILVDLSREAQDVMAHQSTLLELSAPVKMVGDIHGQYPDLLRVFRTAGFPPQQNYLFLGDYVDRGKQSLEVISLLFAFKVKYPDNFFILRGNHEDPNINRLYGFFDECRRRYSVSLWKTFCSAFSYMPLAALVENRILCMHGGIPRGLRSMSQIRNIRRPLHRIEDDNETNEESRIATDLLWADPDPLRRPGFNENVQRHVSCVFGTDKLDEFMTHHDLDLIVRAHEVVEEGYRFFGGPERPKGLVTIFGAPNYTGEFDNAAAIISFDENLCASFVVLAPPAVMSSLKSSHPHTGPQQFMNGRPKSPTMSDVTM